MAMSDHPLTDKTRRINEVHDGQHLLGTGFGGRQKAGAQASNREDGNLHAR